MKTKLITFFLCCFFYGAYSQVNSIKIDASLNDETHTLNIQQQIVFFNKSNTQLSEVYLHNWGNSFKNKETPLTNRFIEDYDKSLYFAKEENRGSSKVHSISVNHNLASFQELKKQIDIIKVELKTPLKPNDSIVISATYSVKLPNAKFTKYGKTNTGYHLRFWYLTPVVYQNGWQTMSNLNIDDLFMDIADYNIKLQLPNYLKAESNLPLKKQGNKYIFSEKNRTDVILSINPIKTFSELNPAQFKIVTDLNFKSLDKGLLQDVLTREIDFIASYLGKYPHQKMMIDKATQRKNPIYGLNQLPKFLSPFSDTFEWDLTMFKALSKKFIENTLLLNKRKDYWLIDGLQTYLLMEYVEKYYPEIKLLGKVSNLWGVRNFNFSKLNFNDKYSFVYQFGARKFLDQSLTTRSDSLSNFNRKIANKYKAGLGIRYLKGYIGSPQLHQSIKEYYTKENLKLTSSNKFADILSSKTNKKLDWFFGDYIQTNKKIDYTIKEVTTENDSVKVTIKNKRNITAPIALYAVKDKKIKLKRWVTDIDSVKTITLPKGDYNKLSLNYEQLYPEHNTLDNWKKLNSSFLNKPIQFKFIKDVEDPYYHQIYYQPEVKYNYYDGIILALKLHNKPIIARNLEFRFAPSYATKSNSITGSFAVLYNQYFEKSKIYKIRYGLAGSSLHYAEDLAYNSITPFIGIQFRRKSLRDVGGSGISARIININKEVAPGTVKLPIDKYNIFNLIYSYNKPDIIQGIRSKFSVEVSKDFTKLNADFRFRKLTAKYRQLDFRVFGGVFLKNNTIGDYFSFGLDRANDYLFDLNYYGRSEDSGIFSQQFIMAEGGFKSKLPVRFANQFMFSFNSSVGLWRWIELYNDIAFLKNKTQSVYFGYESGIRFNFVHNIFELHFPLYSNNGWEVSQKAYPKKIRFVLTANFSAIYNFFKRGFL